MDILIFKEWLEKLGLSEKPAGVLGTVIWTVILLIVSYLAYWITKKIIVNTVVRLIRHTKTKRDDILLHHRIFEKFAHFVPILFLYLAIPFFLKDNPGAERIVRDLLSIYLTIISIIIINTSLNALHDIYLTLPISKNRPIKGYVQVVQILVYFTGLMFIISILFNTKVMTLLGGLGAMAAVMILIFKDTILGFVASLQITANDMVKPGDWIEMPDRGADGTVQEITLYTVKVQNWDKTIVTIPTYSIVSESFKNWRGMEESGGRRIKRSVFIDAKSIRFCTPEMIGKFRKIKILQEYIDKKEKELAEHNRTNNIDDTVLVNGRRMTNIGTFRKYIEEYLKRHPMIHNEMTFLVRQLQMSEKGLPIEIYVFSKDQRWANYEAIQADIFDHIFAIIPEFDLRVFQEPSGYDILLLAERNKGV